MVWLLSSELGACNWSPKVTCPVVMGSYYQDLQTSLPSPFPSPAEAVPESSALKTALSYQCLMQRGRTCSQACVC